MIVPEWWLAVTVICFILSTLCIVALLVGLNVLTSKVQRLMLELSNAGLPKVYALGDQVNGIAARVDGIVARLDSESHVALPKVEHMLDRVDHTMGLVEANSERVNTVIEGTADGINRVRHNPMTRTVLISAGSLAAARLLKNTISHYAGRNGNGHRHAATMTEEAHTREIPPGRSVMEMPQEP